MKTPSELSRLYRNIDRKNLSPTAQETLKKIMKANGNWRKRDEKVQQVFLDFYEKLKEKKPVLIKTTPEYKAQLLEIKRANVRKAAETRAAKFQDSKEKEGAKGNQRDAARPAKRIGWRLKGKNNYKKPTIADIRAKRAYFENRVNRSDKKRKKFPMLEKGGYMADGGIVVTSIKDIPNFEERLNQGRITYRGLGVGKLSNDFYKVAGEGGKIIKVDGKEYYITDTEFNSFSRDADGMLRVKFAAPKRKFERGGYMADGGHISSGKKLYDVSNNMSDKEFQEAYRKLSDREKDIYDKLNNEYENGGAVKHKIFAKLIHQENGIEYYKDNNLIHPTREEKLNWSIYGLPNGVEKNEEQFETTIDEFYGNTKRDIYNQFNEKINNGYYDYLGSSPNIFLQFTDKIAKGGYMARGGQVEFLYSDSNFDNKYFRRFNGAIGSFAWIYEKRYNEGILYPLDAFDLDYYAHLPLKENEVILRYQSDRMRDVDSSMYLIKFNVKKMLVYFMEDAYSDDDKNIKFSPKGLKLEYLTIEWQGLSSKQQMNIDLDKFDKGGNVDATYSVWVRKGASDDEEVVKSNLTKSQAKKLMDSLWDKDEYYEIGMSSSTYGNGGTLEDYDQLIGKTILIYSMGVKTPNSYKISGVKPPDPRFSIPTLMLEVGGGAEYIEGREKIANFLKGNQIEMNAGGEYYAIELVTDSKSKEHYAKGGQTPFEKLSNKVADNYEGKKVPSKYQKLYGKTYDRSEAKEVGDKVAAKVYRLQLKNKMAKGGEILFTDKHRND